MKITFVSAQGEDHTVEAPHGLTLLEVARDNGIEGLDAECGGACSCATCHVMLPPDWIARLGSPMMTEDDLLQILGDQRQPGSRLACQIIISDILDGIRVCVPASQIL